MDLVIPLSQYEELFLAVVAVRYPRTAQLESDWLDPVAPAIVGVGTRFRVTQQTYPMLLVEDGG